MNKIIKITDDEVVVGKDDGSVLKVKKSSVNWKSKVGDLVDVFKDGDNYILSKSVNIVEKKKCKFVSCLVKGCKKLLPIIFSSLFGLFLILTIVLSVMPHGKKYKFSTDILGTKVSSEIILSGDKITVNNYYMGRFDTTESTFKIKNGKIYAVNQETNEYDEIGTITSTKIVTDSGDGYKFVYVETCVKAWIIVAIVFTIIFAVLDAASIAVLILNKKGIIKIKSEVTDKNKTNVVKKESEEDEKITKSQEKVEEQKEAKE